eukprot:gene12850-15186_t
MLRGGFGWCGLITIAVVRREEADDTNYDQESQYTRDNSETLPGGASIKCDYKSDKRRSLTTSLDTYPGYSGNLSGMSGTIEVTPSGLCENDLRVMYNLKGAQPGQLQSGMSAYPGYNGAFTNISGTVTVMRSRGEAGLEVEYNLSGTQSSVLSTGELMEYPGYTGTLRITGTVSVTQKNTTALTVTYDIAGARPNETAGLHVHEGLSCDDARGHYFTGETDAWNAAMYTADALGVARGSFDIDSGFPYSENMGHAFVVHDSSSVRAACGILAEQSWGMHIHEGMTCDEAGGHFWTPMSETDPWNNVTYTPDGEGNTIGKFVIESGYPYAENIGHAFVVHGSEGRIGCGVLEVLSYGMHIHTGTTCSDAEQVGGHYFNTSLDPWIPDCMYTPDGEGNAEGECGPISTGYDIEMNAGHAFVVHAAGGTRIGCGVLH